MLTCFLAAVSDHAQLWEMKLIVHLIFNNASSPEYTRVSKCGQCDSFPGSPISSWLRQIVITAFKTKTLRQPKTTKISTDQCCAVYGMWVVSSVVDASQLTHCAVRPSSIAYSVDVLIPRHRRGRPYVVNIPRGAGRRPDGTATVTIAGWAVGSVQCSAVVRSDSLSFTSISFWWMHRSSSSSSSVVHFCGSASVPGRCRRRLEYTKWFWGAVVLHWINGFADLVLSKYIDVDGVTARLLGNSYRVYRLSLNVSITDEIQNEKRTLKEMISDNQFTTAQVKTEKN